jgi:hypothetical protein
MKDGKLRDCLLLLAMILPAGGAFGALLGWSQNEFGLSSGVRLVLMITFVGLVGRFSAFWVGRRAKARAQAQRGV